MKRAILHDIKINDRFCVTFIETLGNTEGITMKCYLTKHEALMEIDLYENANTYREMTAT